MCEADPGWGQAQSKTLLWFCLLAWPRAQSCYQWMLLLPLVCAWPYTLARSALKHHWPLQASLGVIKIFCDQADFCLSKSFTSLEFGKTVRRPEMIRNTWKNIKMVHKERKKEIFSFQDFYCWIFTLGGRNEDACQHFRNYVPFSTSTALCLFCLDLLSWVCATAQDKAWRANIFQRNKKCSSSSSRSRFSWTGCISLAPLGNSKQNPRIALLTDCCAWASAVWGVWARLGKSVSGDAGQLEDLGKAGSFWPQWSTDLSKLGAWKAKASRLAVQWIAGSLGASKEFKLKSPVPHRKFWVANLCFSIRAITWIQLSAIRRLVSTGLC